MFKDYSYVTRTQSSKDYWFQINVAIYICFYFFLFEKIVLLAWTLNIFFWTVIYIRNIFISLNLKTHLPFLGICLQTWSLSTLFVAYWSICIFCNLWKYIHKEKIYIYWRKLWYTRSWEYVVNKQDKENVPKVCSKQAIFMLLSPFPVEG